jgi:SM-20-related protein
MFSSEEIERLGTSGYFVRDGFLGRELALRVRAEAEGVALRPAGLRRARELDARVRSDEIAWLTAEEATGALGEAVQRFTAAMHALNEAAYLGLRSFDLQLARYAPGGHYDRHLDAFPGQDNRRLTAIVYLNPAWSPRDGGQLRVYRPEGSPGAPGTEEFEPVLDRFVAFRSTLVEHEVLDSKADRWALTAWYAAR